MVGFLPLGTDSFNSGTGEFTRKVERQRAAVQSGSSRKFICAEDVDGQNVTLTGLLGIGQF